MAFYESDRDIHENRVGIEGFDIDEEQEYGDELDDQSYGEEEEEEHDSEESNQSNQS